MCDSKPDHWKLKGCFYCKSDITNQIVGPTSCRDAKQGDFVPILLFFLEILKTDTPTTALIKCLTIGSM